jgi:hypothetical protein
MSVRCTASIVYRSGSEILLHDLAFPTFEAARNACFGDLVDAVDQHVDAIAEGGGQLVLRVATRDYRPMDGGRRAAAPKRRVPRPDEF